MEKNTTQNHRESESKVGFPIQFKFLLTVIFLSLVMLILRLVGIV